jgi:hypothetical protein
MLHQDCFPPFPTIKGDVQSSTSDFRGGKNDTLIASERVEL